MPTTASTPQRDRLPEAETWNLDDLFADEATFVRLKEKAAAPGTRVLALGDPAYPRVGEASGEPGVLADLRGRRLRRLPQTREEAKQVGDEVLVGATAGSVAAVLLGYASVPDRGALTAAVALASAHVALKGITQLPIAVGAGFAGAFAGVALAPRITAATTDAADAIALLLLAGWAISIASAAHERSRQLQAGRRQALGTSARLARFLEG